MKPVYLAASTLTGLLALGIALAPAAPAAPGIAVRLSTVDLLDRCDLCLEARVTAARAVLEPGRRIDTEYTLAVERTFWGEPQASRAIRLPGGVLPDGRGMVIPGLPGLGVGEEVLLFLSKQDPSGMRMPVGLAQGGLRVARDPAGRKRLVRDQQNLTLVPPSTTGGAPGLADPTAVLDYAAAIAEIEVASAARRARERREGGGR